MTSIVASAEIISCARPLSRVVSASIAPAICLSARPPIAAITPRVRRTVYPIQSGGSEIELTIDKGKVEAGRQSSPLCEVELELKRGESAELFKLARMLAEEVPVQLAVKSKAERGYALIVGELPAAVKAAPVVLMPDSIRQAAFQAIARACLRQLVANQPATLGGDAEGLHQMRVALRRRQSRCLPTCFLIRRRRR